MEMQGRFPMPSTVLVSPGLTCSDEEKQGAFLPTMVAASVSGFRGSSPGEIDGCGSGPVKRENLALSLSSVNH